MKYGKWLRKYDNSFVEYLGDVCLAIVDLTAGMLEYDDLPDVVDVAAEWEYQQTPYHTARLILEENGYPLDEQE